MAALLPARRAAAAAAASASAASSASAAASASASAARRLSSSSSSSSSRSLSSVSTAPAAAAAAAAAAATRAMRAPPPVGNMPEPFAWKEEPAPPTPAGWKATTSAPKKTTRLAGLHPEPHAREKLHALYEQTLRAVRRLEGGGGGGERRDNPNPYRAAVEQLTRHRMALVAAEPDIPALEEKIGAGQIEELLQQARDELELIPVMASWRPWERPSAEAGAGGASGGPYPAHEPAVLVEDRAKAFLKDMVDTSPREQK